MNADSLLITVVFSVDTKEYAVPGANIKNLNLELLDSGFKGTFDFLISDENGKDELYKVLGKSSPVYITISYKSYTYNSKVESEETTLKGIVTEREIREIQFDDLKKSAVLLRDYRISFTDTARFFWSQHFPCEIYVNKSLKDVITSQVIDPISLDIQWDYLEQEKPLICLSMGPCQISFYDFLVDYITGNCGYFLYDYKTNSYKITGEKEKCKEKYSPLPHQVADVTVLYEKTSFDSINVLNAQHENASTTSVSINKKINGIKKDTLIITPFAKEVEAQKNLETKKAAAAKPGLRFSMRQFPLKTLVPGSGICFTSKTWNTKLLFFNKNYRTKAVFLRLKACDQGAAHNQNLDFTEFNLDMTVLNEDADNQGFPPFMPDQHSCYVEGLIVSDAGDKNDKTYQYTTNDSTKQHEYRVSIPLWNTEIKVLYHPDFLNPHFYFPLYRDTPVLLELTLFSARIVRILDWGKNVFIDQENQGNQILFGKNTKDETAMKYQYEDNKPVFSIERTKEKDTGLFRMEEGTMILETKEE